ncbi:MAG: Ig-like domain-containing protein [Verrucomicrobia bacterium]|nr:Ig-like domain-containing protein [Verrucomicrobiota bacterium]MDA1066662.1 Ig-like domain-containing protein [Verrucomicrobiota bacterium]
MPIVAQDQEFRVQSIELNENGVLALEFPSEAESYYLLKRGQTVDVLDSAVAAQLGINGTGFLSDSEFASPGKTFYVVQKIPISDPLDTDGDGIDDVFELGFPNFLSPVNPFDAPLDFDQDTVSNLKEYQDGTNPSLPPARIFEMTPTEGEEMVNVTRNAVLRFNQEMDPESIDENSFYLQQNQTRIEGTVEVSSTKRFATFFPKNPFPSSTQIKVIVDGNLIHGLSGDSLDADGNGTPGGINQTVFRTLPSTRIPGTNVWGYVKDSFTEEPIKGVTIFVNAFPAASATTDSNGRFELVDMPIPEFFVHIVGGTADNTPNGFTYPNVGKSFHSFPGQSIQISMDGDPFDIYLPLMSLGDVETLSETETTEVGFGTEGKSVLTNLFPGIDPSMWDGVCVEIAPGSARDDIGNTFTQASIIPVPPDRIPAPLPQELAMPLVISIQTFGATRFDVPAAVRFPNLPDPLTGEVLLPGAKSGLWSFNHDAGRWELQGSMTVSEDGMHLISDPGVGILAPGWHGINNGNSGDDGGASDDDGPCETEEKQMQQAALQCMRGAAINLLKLSPGIGCAVSVATSAADFAVGCDIDPSGCNAKGATKAAVGAAIGCIPGIGLVKNLLKSNGIAENLAKLAVCKSGGASSGFPTNLSDPGYQLFEDSYIQLFQDQIDLMERTQDLNMAVTGDLEWWAVPVEELDTLESWMVSIDEAMFTESPGGAVITGAEATALKALPRPSNLTEAHLDAFIDRLNRFSTGGMTDQEQSTLVQAATSLQDLTELLEASGWETTYDGFVRGMAALSGEISVQISPNSANGGLGTLSTHNGEHMPQIKASPLYFKLTDVYSGFTRRGRLNGQGKFDGVILAANTFYVVEYADPDTLEVGTAAFESPEAGSSVKIPAVFLTESDEPDSDLDGLPNDVEETVGTDPLDPDTDGDGINDGEELQQGQNPLNGLSLPVGTLATIPLSDNPFGIDTDSEHAYVATNRSGLAIIDISDPLLPILESELDLPGVNLNVAISPSAQVAAVTADRHFLFDEPGAIHFVDISDTTNPNLLRSLHIEAQSVIHEDGIFYVLVGAQTTNEIHMFDASSLDPIGLISTEGNISGMLTYKNMIFAAVDDNLVIYDLNDPTFPTISSTPFPGNKVTISGIGWQILAENDVLYVGTNDGYETMDITDPAFPQLITAAAGTHPFRA